ncbi:MAG: tRNA (adenosine(37)-N6)-dimethylallyltransferase MiaA [Anaerolineae bacterium]|nr:tRNA (adenosine(37)-N6)-dimethylallyltransferase MiaA [Anaerolineae bacterium]
MTQHQRTFPLIVIVGPTAVGKTALGVHLAEQFGGEVISADSRQFYREMTIGTAKPTSEDMRRVRHHLVDIANPDETVGLAHFLRLAREAIDDVAARRAVPFIVGGTGQYVQALLQGWQVPEVPPDPELRADLETQAASDPDALWRRLLALDSHAIDFVDPRNIRRVVRALEVTIKSGQPFSALRRRISPPYDPLTLCLTMDRAALYARADARVDAMVAAGLEQEVRALLDRGYTWELPAMSGLGYSQFRPYIEGSASLSDVVERIKLDTHDFVRRQYAWFRAADPEVLWLDAADPATPARAAEAVAAALGAPA